MATTTTNYGLTKPENSDLISPSVFANDFDTIDVTMKGIADDLAAFEYSVNNGGMAPVVGDIKATIKSSIGESWALCNGASVNPSAYPSLAAIIPEDPFTTEWTVSNLAEVSSSYITGSGERNEFVFYKNRYFFIRGNVLLSSTSINGAFSAVTIPNIPSIWGDKTVTQYRNIKVVNNILVIFGVPNDDVNGLYMGYSLDGITFSWSSFMSGNSYDIVYSDGYYYHLTINSYALIIGRSQELTGAKTTVYNSNIFGSSEHPTFYGNVHGNLLVINYKFKYAVFDLNVLKTAASTSGVGTLRTYTTSVSEITSIVGKKSKIVELNGHVYALKVGYSTSNSVFSFYYTLYDIEGGTFTSKVFLTSPDLGGVSILFSVINNRVYVSFGSSLIQYDIANDTASMIELGGITYVHNIISDGEKYVTFGQVGTVFKPMYTESLVHLPVLDNSHVNNFIKVV